MCIKDCFSSKFEIKEESKIVICLLRKGKVEFCKDLLASEMSSGNKLFLLPGCRSFTEHFHTSFCVRVLATSIETSWKIKHPRMNSPFHLQ